MGAPTRRARARPISSCGSPTCASRRARRTTASSISGAATAGSRPSSRGWAPRRSGSRSRRPRSTGPAPPTPSSSFRLAPIDGPLPFDDDSFDVVWASEVIEHVADTARWLSEVRRVLVPRGRLLLTTPSHGRLRVALSGVERSPQPLGDHLHLYTKGSLENLLAEFGFGEISVRPPAGRRFCGGCCSRVLCVERGLGLGDQRSAWQRGRRVPQRVLQLRRARPRRRRGAGRTAPSWSRTLRVPRLAVDGRDQRVAGAGRCRSAPYTRWPGPRAAAPRSGPARRPSSSSASASAGWR